MMGFAGSEFPDHLLDLPAIEQDIAAMHPQGLIRTKAPVGDLNSSARGSGARFNADKPPMELLDIRFVAAFYGSDDEGSPAAVRALWRLADWQATGDITHVVRASRLLGLPSLLECSRVLTYGLGKYAPWNWAKGMPWSVPLACAVRHLMEDLEGRRTDDESGRTHLGHVQANLMMLVTFQRVYPEGNDLPKPLNLSLDQ